MRRRLAFSALLALVLRRPVAAAVVQGNRVVVGDRLRPAPGSLVVSLPRLPLSNSLALYLNGMRMTPGVDYTQSGVTITFIQYYADMDLSSDQTVIVADYWIP